MRPTLADAGHEALLDGAFVVTALHVLPDWHGRGVGGRLLRALLEDADAPRALLTTQGGSNRARGLYRAAGFREVVNLDHDGTPFLVLVRSLDEA